MSTTRLDPLRPTVPDVLPRLEAYLARHGNEAGGSLHLVLDDRNVSDDDVLFCIYSAQERGDTEGGELARVLLRMSPTQRAKIASKAKRVSG